jgi:MFS family permease
MSRTRVLVLLSLAELLAMSLWFTGTAVLPQLARAWNAGLSVTAWLTIAVQLGFVAGALLIAVLNLADVLSAPRLFVASALLAAAANAAFGSAATSGRHIGAALACRMATGAFLAGVYPTGMKILAGWYREGRGLALGVLIGALTVGSALPHLMLALSARVTVPVRAVVNGASALAVIAAVIVALTVHEGPLAAPSPRFDPRQVGELRRNRALLLANLGYLGHMWEVYSVWGWIAVLLAAASSAALQVRELIAFAAIAIGAVGCVWGGVASDRLTRSASMSGVAGRARVTIYAMAASAGCCVLAALVFQNFWLLVIVVLLWGIAVVADSAQFSAIVSEVADQRYVGTALTTQTALGFLLTTVSLRVTAAIAASGGWRWAAASLAIGPLLGIWAMAALMRSPRR